MRFAKAGVAVDKKRVIELGRLCRHGKAGRVGKFVARPHNEGVKCIFVIVPARFFHGLGFFVRRAHLDADIPRAENLGKSLLDGVQIIMQNGFPVKVIGDFQHGGAAGKVHAHRFDACDPGGIGDFCDFLAAVVANQVPRFGKGIHVFSSPR